MLGRIRKREETQALTIMDYPREVYEQAMFFPGLTGRQEAERKIRKDFQGQGTYLLRPSSTGDYNYFSLSISESESQIHHVKINIEYQGTASPKYYLASNMKFSPLCELLKFYSLYEIQVEEKIKNLKLNRPLNCRTPEVIQRDSQNSQRSGVGWHVDPAETGEKSIPEYLELQSGPNEYLKTEISAPLFKPPITVTSSDDKQFINTSSPVKVKGKEKLSIKSRIFSKKRRSKSVTQESGLPTVVSTGTKTRSYSALNPSQFPSSLQDRQHHCRPPAPLPLQNIPESDGVIYSIVDTHHDYFEETYKYLKESEVCECGLLLTESELPCGWAVHLSKEEPTVDFVFFQHEDTTTWDIPEEILPSLSKKQISFILKLCYQRPCPIPKSLTEFIKSEFERNNSMTTCPSQASITRNNSLQMTTSPIQASIIRNSSLSSSMSALSLSSSPSTGSKLFEYKAKRRNSTGMKTRDEKGHAIKEDELPDNEDQFEIEEDAVDDGGGYEKAEKLFDTNSAKSCERDVTTVSQESELSVVLGKPQPTVRRSAYTSSCYPDSNPYIMEDVEVDAKSDIAQHDLKRSRASSWTSSTKSSSSLCDFTRPLSKQIMSETPLKGTVEDGTFATEHEMRKSGALTYSFKAVSSSGNISSQDVILPPGPVEIIAVANQSTQLTQHQLLQLQQQSQVGLYPPQQPQGTERAGLYQLNDTQHVTHDATPTQLQQQSQVGLHLPQRPQAPERDSHLYQLNGAQHTFHDATPTQHQLLQLQQQSQVGLHVPQRPQTPERASHLYQLNKTQHIIHDATPQLITQVGAQQQYQFQHVHLPQVLPSAMQPVQISGPNLQHPSGQGQIFAELPEQQLLQVGDQMSQNSSQTVIQESLQFQSPGPRISNHPLQTQQYQPSVNNDQIFYIVRDKPN